MICFLTISLCISVFGLLKLTEVSKLVPLQSHGGKYFSVEMNTFSKPLTADKISFQLLAALQNLDPAVNHKPYTWPSYK